MLACRFHIDAEQDPQIAARLLALVTVRNDLPDKFSLVKDGMRLQIILETLCRDSLGARLLMCKIQNIPTIINVSCVMLAAGAIEPGDMPTAPAFWI